MKCINILKHMMENPSSVSFFPFPASKETSVVRDNALSSVRYCCGWIAVIAKMLLIVIKKSDEWSQYGRSPPTVYRQIRSMKNSS